MTYKLISKRDIFFNIKFDITFDIENDIIFNIIFHIKIFDMENDL